jgi:hypothetical protein
MRVYKYFFNLACRSQSVTILNKAKLCPLVIYTHSITDKCQKLPLLKYNTNRYRKSLEGNDIMVLILWYCVASTTFFCFQAGAGNFSLNHRVKNVSGAHPASYPMGTRGSFPGGKAAGA